MSTPRIASWIIIQALQISRENIAGYSIQDAHLEILDLEDAVTAYKVLGSDTSDLSKMTSIINDLKDVLNKMREERDEKLRANGLDVAAREGFQMKTIGSVTQFFKPIPDIEGGHYVIDFGGGIDKYANADIKDWGVTANIRQNGLNNYTTVYEKLTLADALAAYRDLPLPIGDGLIQNVYDTWNDVRAAAATPGI